MKCINKTIAFILTIFLSAVLTGCGSAKLTMPYDPDSEVTSYSVMAGDDDRAVPFAKDLCVIAGDDLSVPEIEAGEDSYGAAGLFDVTGSKPLYSRNVYATLYPASLTKIMTAICAMKYASKDDIVKCSSNVYIAEEGAQVCGFEEGDELTMDQAMHALLMYSGNDAAVAIAESVSGSVDNFCKLMNDEANSLGATGTHFVNPNGLHDENHYTTAYDMYLIFNEAIKYDWFNEIINMDSYTTTYKTADGGTREVSWGTTNLYLKGEVAPLSNVTVIGGKTGTTQAAGNNLVILSKDEAGNPYISVVMKATGRDVVYAKTSSLLENIK